MTIEPDVIQAIGVAVAAILGANQARMGSKLRDMDARLRVVEAERDRFRSLFRAAVRHIREWMAWATSHVPGTQPPPLPPELLDEI